MRQLLAVSILAVLSLATYGMPFQVSKPTKDQSTKDIVVKYNKFKDVTTVSTTMMLSKGRHLFMLAALAVREGQDTTSPNRFYLSLYTSDTVIDGDAKLILLVDGVRSTLTPTSGYSETHAAVFPTTIEQLAKIGAANSVEGQVDSIEFGLTPMHCIQVKRFVEYFH